MWVGQRHYTPEEFIEEEKRMGICKAIKQKPNGLVLGETWVMVAHPQAISGHEDPRFQKAFGEWMNGGQKGKEPQPPNTPGIFYAFKPTRIEVLVYKSQASPERIAELEAKGITPIIVSDEHQAHARKTRKSKGRVNIS